MCRALSCSLCSERLAEGHGGQQTAPNHSTRKGARPANAGRRAGTPHKPAARPGEVGACREGQGKQRRGGGALSRGHCRDEGQKTQKLSQGVRAGPGGLGHAFFVLNKQTCQTGGRITTTMSRMEDGAKKRGREGKSRRAAAAAAAAAEGAAALRRPQATTGSSASHRLLASPLTPRAARSSGGAAPRRPTCARG